LWIYARPGRFVGGAGVLPTVFQAVHFLSVGHEGTFV